MDVYSLHVDVILILKNWINYIGLSSFSMVPKKKENPIKTKIGE